MKKIDVAKSPDILTVADVAKILGFSETRTRNAMRTGEIPGCFRVGHRTRISRSSLDRFIQGQKGNE